MCGRYKCLKLSVCLLLLCLAHVQALEALKVFPSQTDIGKNYHEEQSFIFTVLNDGPQTEEVRVTPGQYSQYLTEYVRIEPRTFVLEPNTKENVQLTTDFPRNLSPQEHELVLRPVSEHSAGDTAEYSFTVEGVARPELEVEGFSLERTDEYTVQLDVLLANTGNVIVKAHPQIFVYNGSARVDELRYESPVQVMPFSEYNLTLLYDHSALAEGAYDMRINFSYWEDARTNTEESTFETTRVKTEGSVDITAYLRWVGLALLLAIMATFAVRPQSLKSIMGRDTARAYPRELRQRVARISQRQRRLDKEINQIVKDTHSFIDSANRWMGKHLGESYRFK